MKTDILAPLFKLKFVTSTSCFLSTFDHHNFCQFWNSVFEIRQNFDFVFELNLSSLQSSISYKIWWLLQNCVTNADAEEYTFRERIEVTPIKLKQQEVSWFVPGNYLAQISYYKGKLERYI